MIKVKEMLIQVLKKGIPEIVHIQLDSLGNIVFLYQGKKYKLQLSEALDHYNIY